MSAPQKRTVNDRDFATIGDAITEALVHAGDGRASLDALWHALTTPDPRAHKEAAELVREYADATAGMARAIAILEQMDRDLLAILAHAIRPESSEDGRQAVQ